MAQKKVNTENKVLLTLFVIILTTFDLLFIIYIKYDNQHLPLSDFRLYYAGNLLNIAFTIILIAGLIIYLFKKNINLSPVSIFALAAAMTIFLFVAWIFSKSPISLPNVTILNQPFSRVFVSGLFFIYQFIEFILIMEVWLSLSKKSNLIFLRAFVDAILITMILLVFSFLYLNFNKAPAREFFISGKGNNVGVVLGAAVWTNEPSPSLRARIDRAFSLYKNGSLQKIQLTGGNAPGELSEAEIAYEYLKTKKMDTSDIWIEKRTSSTTEQIQFIKKNLSTKPGVNDIIVISDSYHLPRVKQIADFYLLDIDVAPSDLDLRFENKLYNKLRESAAILIFWFFAI
jgi:uncharacterized SAM-binding protein YcdF (DUF218 family)